MKLIYILRAILALALVGALASCRSERENDPSETEISGAMKVEVIEKNGEGADRIGCIRFFVFDNPSSAPVLEVNEFFGEEDFKVDQASGDNEVSKLRVVLEVGYRPGGDNDKLVVAVANEPASMSAALQQVSVPGDLERLTLDFADFLNTGHNALETGAAMPMTAAIRTDKVYGTEEQAKNDPAGMSLERAVARVDVYMKRGTDVGEDVKLAAGTKIALGNTYDRMYLLYHPSSTYTVGQIQTVMSGFLIKTWTLTAGVADISPVAPVCGFYTPERTCIAPGDADKLRLDFEVITSEGALRTGGISIAAAIDDNGQEKDINAIRRNNIYRITARIDANEISCIVHEWNTETIEPEL